MSVRVDDQQTTTDEVTIDSDTFRNGECPVAVYGLGKLGLPAATVFAERCGTVIGVDTDQTVVDEIGEGSVPFSHEEGLESLLCRVIDEGAFTVTGDGASAARSARIHVIVVPVPLNSSRSADLSAIDEVVSTIAAGLSAGDLVVIESTVPPGTCRDHVRPALANAASLDNEQFMLASCPERMSSGRALRDIRGAHPRIVGGVDAASTEAAASVYHVITANEVLPVANARTAEAVKLFEGVYRDVNIALANELATALDGTGIDVRDTITAANTLSVCDIHDPGAGVGGHCIPYYPYFLMGVAATGMPLLSTARRVNDRMPVRVIERLERAFDERGQQLEGMSITVLGVAYRPEIPETAATPARPIIEALRARGAEVSIVDPVVSESATEWDFDPLDTGALTQQDGIVLVTPHEAFVAIDWHRLQKPVIVDTTDTVPREVATDTIGGQP